MKRLLNKKMVAEKCATTTRTIDRKRAAGEFPEPIDLGGPKWEEEVIDEWLEAKRPNSTS